MKSKPKSLTNKTKCMKSIGICQAHSWVPKYCRQMHVTCANNLFLTTTYGIVYVLTHPVVFANTRRLYIGEALCYRKSDKVGCAFS